MGTGELPKPENHKMLTTVEAVDQQWVVTVAHEMPQAYEWTATDFKTVQGDWSLCYRQTCTLSAAGQFIVYLLTPVPITV